MGLGLGVIQWFKICDPQVNKNTQISGNIGKSAKNPERIFRFFSDRTFLPLLVILKFFFKLTFMLKQPD